MPQKKRVLIFSTAYYPYVGGAEVALKEITDRLSESHEFALVTAQFSRELPTIERIGNVTVYRVGIGIPILDKLWLPWGGALRAVSLHRERAFDLFWCMMATYASGAAYIANFFLAPKLPIVLTLQEGDSEQYLRWKWGGLINLSWRAALAGATAVTAISTYLGNRARLLGFQGLLEIIPNGVDIAAFSSPQDSAELEKARERLGKLPSDIFLITTSRLTHKNALDDVIRALPLLPQYVHFAILGTGPDRTKLEALAQKVKVDRRVHFLGFVSHSDMPRFLHSADIFVRPSRSEGMGNSFIEAMAAGLPVIGTQEGGIADFLFDVRRQTDSPATGWAVDKNSPAQIAAAVKEILDQPEQVARVTKAAKELVHAKYGWDLSAARMTELFDKAAEIAARITIVVATPLYPPEIGGPATYAKILNDQLPAYNIQVELVKFSDVRHLPKLVRHWIFYSRVLRAARRANAVLALDPVSVGLPTMKAARDARKPFAVKIVGDYAWEQGRQRFSIIENLDEFVKMKDVPMPVRILRKVQTRVARRAARVIVPSEYLKHIVMEWGIRDDMIDVIYNAIPLEELGTVPKSVAALPRPLVVAAGRLVPWKNIEGIIDAVAGLPDASLTIVGDGPLRAALERRAQASLPGRSILTGQLPHRDTLAVLKCADVFVLNSSYEGLSHLLIEAVALGIPVIATRVGGNPEVITHEENGLLIPPGDTPALVAALKRLLSDGALASNLSRGASESAKRFSLDMMLSRTSDVLRELGHRVS